MNRIYCAATINIVSASYKNVKPWGQSKLSLVKNIFWTVKILFSFYPKRIFRQTITSKSISGSIFLTYLIYISTAKGALIACLVCWKLNGYLCTIWIKTSEHNFIQLIEKTMLLNLWENQKKKQSINSDEILSKHIFVHGNFHVGWHRHTA